MLTLPACLHLCIRSYLPFRPSSAWPILSSLFGSLEREYLALLSGRWRSARKWKGYTLNAPLHHCFPHSMFELEFTPDWRARFVQPREEISASQRRERQPDEWEESFSKWREKNINLRLRSQVYSRCMLVQETSKGWFFFHKQGVQKRSCKFLREDASQISDLQMASDLCCVGQCTRPFENVHFLFVYNVKCNEVSCTHWIRPLSYIPLPFTVGLGYFITCEVGITFYEPLNQKNPHNATVALRLVHMETGKHKLVTHPRRYRSQSTEDGVDLDDLSNEPPTIVKKVAIWQDRILCGIIDNLGFPNKGEFSWFVFKGPSL